MEHTLREDQTRRYLQVLGVSAQPCKLQALDELVSAHLRRIPFENISMLHRYRTTGLTGTPELDTFLDGVEELGFGGMCYSSNVHFFRLLQTLRYDAVLCGADMQTPNAHMVVRVTLEGKQYLVDVGYGAPFYRAMPLGLAEDFVVPLPHAAYVLQPADKHGRVRMEFRQNGMLKQFYVVNPQPMQIPEFDTVITAMFAPGATFRKTLLMARFGEGQFCILYNQMLLEVSAQGVHAKGLPEINAICAFVADKFGMQAKLVRDVVGDLPAFALAAKA